MASFDPYYKWFGIPPEEQPPNYYRLLGITLFEGDERVIEAAAERQAMFLRSLQNGPHGELSQQILNHVTKASICLLKPEQKQAYDHRLRQKLEATSTSDKPATVADSPVPTAPQAPVPPNASVPATTVATADEGLHDVLGSITQDELMDRSAMRRRNLWVGRVATSAVVLLVVVIGWVLFRSFNFGELAGPIKPDAKDRAGKNNGKSKRDPERDTLKQEEDQPPTQKLPEGPINPAVAQLVEFPPARQALPIQFNRAELAAAEANVKKRFPAAYDSKKPEVRKAVAQRLFKRLAQGVDPAPIRYVMLKNARELSSALADFRMKHDLSGRWAEFANIDPILERARIFESAREKGDESFHRWAAWRCLYDAHLAERNNQFEIGRNLVLSARIHARQVPGTTAFVGALDWLGGRIQLHEEWFYRFHKAARDSNPEPAALSWRMVGEYLCLHDGRWNEGLQCLAQTKDGTLLELVELETKGGLNDDEMKRLRELWRTARQGAHPGIRHMYDRQAEFWRWRLQLAQGSGQLPEGNAPTDKEIYELPIERLESGLIHTAYSGRYFERKLGQSVDSRIYHNFGVGPGHSAAPNDLFSNQWQGFLYPPVPGHYRLSTSTDDGIRFYLDGKQLITHWRAGAAGKRSVVVRLEDRPHSLRFDFNDLMVTAAASLTWTFVGLEQEEVIRPPSLFHYAQAGRLNHKPQHYPTSMKSLEEQGLLRIYDDQPELLFHMRSGHGVADSVPGGLSGKPSIRVRGSQRYADSLPVAPIRICEHPGPGEFRYIGFAWKKEGPGDAICIQLKHQFDWGPRTDHGIGSCRYFSGPSKTEPFGAGLRLSDKLPTEWTIVVRDLYQDFGEIYLRGISLAPLKGTGYFDQIYLARDRKVLEQRMQNDEEAGR